jgi:DNA-binding NtrC family response regulator
MAALLVVDPDRNFREALAIALRLDGMKVVASAGTEDAMRWLSTTRFDACLADARLAGLDELAHAAARSGARLLLTGPHAEVVAAAARRHAAAAVPKPVRPTDLAARLGARGQAPAP